MLQNSEKGQHIVNEDSDGIKTNVVSCNYTI